MITTRTEFKDDKRLSPISLLPEFYLTSRLLCKVFLMFYMESNQRLPASIIERRTSHPYGAIWIKLERSKLKLQTALL